MYYCFSDITNMANLLTFVCLSWLFTDSTDSTYISDELILMQYSQYRSENSYYYVYRYVKERETKLI